MVGLGVCMSTLRRAGRVIELEKGLGYDGGGPAIWLLHTGSMDVADLRPPLIGIDRICLIELRT